MKIKNEWDQSNQYDSGNKYNPHRQNDYYGMPGANGHLTDNSNQGNKKNNTAAWVIVGIVIVAIIGFWIYFYNQNSYNNYDYDNLSSFYDSSEVDTSYNNYIYENLTRPHDSSEDTNSYDDEPEKEVEKDEIGMYSEAKSEKQRIFDELDKEIKEINKTLPMTVDIGIDWINIAYTKYCIIYTYSVDEDLLDMELFKQNKTEIKKDIKNNIRKQEGVSKLGIESMSSLCKELNLILRIQYKGNKTKKTCNIDIHYTELQ